MPPAKVLPPATPLRGRWILALHAAVLLTGIVCAFRPTLFSGGARLQTDPGDTVLNHYILEHTWTWLTRSDYVGTFWSPPCFYPTKLTLAYSENLLGTAPVYWLLRSFCTPVAAYAVWILLVCSFSYASMAWALRRFGLAHVLCAFGGFVFAFGLPRVLQIGHQQLLPHFYAPLAVYCAWQLIVAPRLLAFVGLLAAGFLQVLSSIYLGWFLHFGLAVFFLWLLVTHRDSVPNLAGFVRRSWLPIGGLLAVWALLLVSLLSVYRQANQGFQREWDECLSHTPSLTDWLLPTDQSMHFRWLGVKTTPQSVECCCFPGWVVLGLTVLGLALALGRFRLLSREHSRLVLAVLGTALTLVVLSLRDLGDGTTWWWVHEWVPGATSIRAVGRITLTVLLFALIGGLLALQAVLRAPVFGPRARWSIAGIVLLLGGLEQVLPTLSSFETASFYPRAEALGKNLRRSAAAYVFPRPDMCWPTNELLAMWAGLHANRPVVNGYSGRMPDGYPVEPLPPGMVFGWLQFNMPPGELWPGKLLFVAPDQKRPDEYRSVLLEADRGAVASSR
jgi:hypothetical protein